jgi:hypothetical protein
VVGHKAESFAVCFTIRRKWKPDTMWQNLVMHTMAQKGLYSGKGGGGDDDEIIGIMRFYFMTFFLKCNTEIYEINIGDYTGIKKQCNKYYIVLKYA